MQNSDYFLSKAFLKASWVKGCECFQGSSQYSKLRSRKVVSIHTSPNGTKRMLFVTLQPQALKRWFRMFLFWSRTLIVLSLFFFFSFLFLFVSLWLEVWLCIYCSFVFFSFSKFGCPLLFNNWTIDHYSMHLFCKFQTTSLLLKRVKGGRFAHAWSREIKVRHCIPCSGLGLREREEGMDDEDNLKDRLASETQPVILADEDLYFLGFILLAFCRKHITW